MSALCFCRAFQPALAEVGANGEGVNLWRQQILCLPAGRLALFCDRGPYGKEHLCAKTCLWGPRSAAPSAAPLA